jgi:hypothetical protein
MTTNNFTSPAVKALDISRDCTLIGLSIRTFTGNVKDKGTSADVASNNGADDDRVSVYLSALPKDVRKPIQQKAGEARRYLDSQTCPWDTGLRLLPNTRRDVVVAKLQEFQTEFFDLVKEHILDRYSELERAAQNGLGSLFAKVGFPAKDTIEEKYEFEVKVDVAPSPADLRLNHVSPKARLEIEATIQKQNDARVKVAHEHVIQTITSALEAIVTKLPKFEDGEIKRFEDSLIGNLTDAVEVLPSLNVTGDPVLADACNKARAIIAKAQLPVLRDKAKPEAKAHRKEVAKAAGDILSAIKSGAVTGSIK